MKKERYEEDVSQLPISNLYELTLFYEKELSDHVQDFSYDNEDVKQFCADNNIDFSQESRPKQKDGAANKIRINNSKGNEGISFIAHVRNAFAHALFNPWKEDVTYLEFKDYSDPKKKKNINAYGIIKVDLLFGLTDLIRKSLKHKQNS